MDSNSSDATRTAVEEFAHRTAMPVTDVFEPRQGISQARNSGVRRAPGDIITLWAPAVVSP